MVRLDVVLFAVFLAAAGAAEARRIDITPDDVTGYLAIEAAADGDVVVIAPGTYRYRVSLTQAVGHIVIRAADPLNWPVFDYTGKNAAEWPGSSTSGPESYRGCWRVSGGAQLEIYGLVIRGCVEDLLQGRAASAIFLDRAEVVTLRGLDLGGSDYGISGVSRSLLIEHVHIHDPVRRGLEIRGGNELTIRYSTLTGGDVTFAVMAVRVTIEYSWFSRASAYTGYMDSCGSLCGGTGSDPLTQQLFLRANVLLHSTPTDRFQMVKVFSSTGSSTDASGRIQRAEIGAVNNTFIGADNFPDTENVLYLENDTIETSARLDNNVFYRMNNVVSAFAPGNPTYSISGLNNWATLTTNSTGLSDTYLESDPMFENAALQDFRPSQSSGLRAGGGPSPVGLPDREYFLNEVEVAKYRLRGAGVGMGAFQYGTSGPGIEAQPPPIPPDLPPVQPGTEPELLPHQRLGVSCACGTGPGGNGFPWDAGLLVFLFGLTRLPTLQRNKV